MRKIKQWVARLSVKKKLIFYGYLIITPVLILICLFLLAYNYHKVLNASKENDLSNVTALSENISMLQTDIKEFSTYLCINDEVLRILRSSEPESVNENSQLWIQEAPMQIVQDMMSLKSYIKTAAIYPENGVNPYLRGMDGSVYLSDIDVIRRTETYRQTQSSAAHILWSRADRSGSEIYQANHSDKVVLCREVYDQVKNSPLGYIVIGVSQDKFRELCESFVQEEEGVLILDRSGGELCRSGQIPGEVETYLMQDVFLSQDYRQRETFFAVGQYNVVCVQKDANESIVCKIVPDYSLRMNFVDFAYMPFALLFGILAGMLPLFLVISNIVTKPLRQVSEAIVKFSRGDFDQKIQVTTYDEVGEVALCFNKMVEDIRTLINDNYVITLKEKESELTALQAQINPHFLYNTLDSLYWQAMGEGNEEIAESILALSQLFRLVLNQGQREIMLSQELELISRYLQIQKMRFSRRLSYEIEVEDEIQSARIPKLILQPFVENAIVHGFENVSTPCYLTIRGYREQGYVHLEVRDTGIGMSQSQLAQLYEEEPTQYARQRIGRYAIRNIRERLELKYHADYRLEITSDVGKGTTVILVIPFEGKEDEGDEAAGGR